MAFLKKQWQLIALVAVGLASIGGGAWAYVAGDAVVEKMQAVNSVRMAAEQARRTPANRETIAARKKEIEEANVALQRSLDAALMMQKNNPFYAVVGADGRATLSPRRPLVEQALPKPASAGARFEFKTAYIREFARLNERLHGGPPPTRGDVKLMTDRMTQLRQPTARDDEPANPWAPRVTAATGVEDLSAGPTLAQLMREYPEARAAEERARQIWMYVDPNALGRHRLVGAEDPPGDVDIWQAQMSLWIQQDLVTALAACNERRAAELARKGQTDRQWVAFMPVKRLRCLRIDDRLGNGGGSNLPAQPPFAQSFTGLRNDTRMFVVPMRLELVVEQAAINQVLAGVCTVAFYTPIRVQYRAVKPNLFYENNQYFIYGNDPVVELDVDLEACFFRQVFDQWIPPALKPVLQKTEPFDENVARPFGGRGGG